MSAVITAPLEGEKTEINIERKNKDKRVAHSNNKAVYISEVKKKHEEKKERNRKWQTRIKYIHDGFSDILSLGGDDGQPVSAHQEPGLRRMVYHIEGGWKDPRRHSHLLEICNIAQVAIVCWCKC
jgi:hypothetical protein